MTVLSKHVRPEYHRLLLLINKCDLVYDIQVMENHKITS